MDKTAGDVVELAGLDRHEPQQRLNLPRLERRAEPLDRDALLQAVDDLRARSGGDRVPHLVLGRFRLRVALDVGSRGVDLDAEPVVGVKKLDDQWEAVVLGRVCPEQLTAVTLAQLVERAAGERPVLGNGAIGRAINDLPRLTDLQARRDLAAKARCERPSAPDALFEDRVKAERIPLH